MNTSGSYAALRRNPLATDWDSGSLFRWSARQGVETLTSGFKGPADFCVILAAKELLVVVPDLPESELRMIRRDG